MKNPFFHFYCPRCKHNSVSHRQNYSKPSAIQNEKIYFTGKTPYFSLPTIQLLRSYYGGGTLVIAYRRFTEITFHLGNKNEKKRFFVLLCARFALPLWDERNNKMGFKEQRERFKVWQREPMHYKNHNKGSIRCANCGAEVEANFCPMCGQKHNVGRLTWKAVHQNIAMLWGLESRTMLGTLLQLCLRPGHLISDYLDGKRQRSYPPVKMLIVVGIGVLLFNYLFAGPPTPDAGSAANTNYGLLLDQIVGWGKRNPAWGGLVLCALLEIPTWLLFRFAPRHPKHTLPEGFFIQVFMAPIVIVLLLMKFMGIYRLIPIALYYIVAYHQLFGYGWWGTAWRTMLCMAGTLWLVLIPFIIEMIAKGAATQGHDLGTGTAIAVNVSLTIVYTVPIVLILAVGYFIGKRRSMRRA